jgi:ABC-type metal ion transport system substrate-binding protein
MTNDSIEFVVAIVAMIVAGIGLTVATISLALIVGVKNSTHQVVWKPVEAPSEEEEEEILNEVNFQSDENPNKKFKQPKVEEPFSDLSDPLVSSNDW